MAADRAADAPRWMQPAAWARIEVRLVPETCANLTTTLAFQENSAGRLMTTKLVSVRVDWTIERTLEHARSVERNRETIYAIYVLDEARSARLASKCRRRARLRPARAAGRCDPIIA